MGIHIVWGVFHGDDGLCPLTGVCGMWWLCNLRGVCKLCWCVTIDEIWSCSYVDRTSLHRVKLFPGSLFYCLNSVETILSVIALEFWFLMAYQACSFLICIWGLIYPFIWIQLNSAKVIAVGPGGRDRDGKLVPVSLKEGDTVLLPEYGGMEVKLAEKEYVKPVYHMNLVVSA